MDQGFRDYRVNFQSHLRLLNSFLWYFGFYVVAMMCIWLIKLNGYEIWLWSSTGVMLVFLLPSLYLHYCYNEHAANTSIKVYEKHIEIFKDKELVLTIDEDYIVSIEIFMCNGLINYDFTNGLPVEDYSYLRFTTKKEEIIINNLIHPNLKLLAARFINTKPIYRPTLFAQP